MSRIALVVFDLTCTHRVSANTYQEINTSLNYTLILHIISGCNVNKDSIPLWSFGLHFIRWGIYPSHFILFVRYQKITRNKDTAFFVLLWSLQNPCNCIDLTTQIIYSNRSQPGSYTGPEAANWTWYGHCGGCMCDECVRKHAQARGVWGHAPPENF